MTKIVVTHETKYSKTIGDRAHVKDQVMTIEDDVQDVISTTQNTYKL